MGNSNFSSHPFLLGFEQLEQLIERGSKNSGYPPFNIEQNSENRFRITLAVAGFGEEELSISFVEGELDIKGVQAESATEQTFLHQGIAARQFQRKFVLARGVEVRNAYMENGLLHIDLERDNPKPNIRKIEINAG